MLKKIYQEFMEIRKGVQATQNCLSCEAKQFPRKEKDNSRFAEDVLKILQWRADGNYLSALAYDRDTRQILVNKDSLMRAIQLANPGQAYRDIRLISHEEYKSLKDKRSDYTSWDEEVRRERNSIESAGYEDEKKSSTKNIDVIVEVSMFEGILMYGKDEKGRMEKIIDTILEQTKKCPSVKIIFTSKSHVCENSARKRMIGCDIR